MLRGYQGEDIEIQLPGNLTVYDIDWLAVWCVQYKHNFGHVFIPKDLDVPPALGQTKIAVINEPNIHINARTIIHCLPIVCRNRDEIFVNLIDSYGVIASYLYRHFNELNQIMNELFILSCKRIATVVV